MIDYDGFNQAPLTNLRSTSLSPAWSPTRLVGGLHLVLQGLPVPLPGRSRSTRGAGGRSPSSCPPGRGSTRRPAWAPDGRTLALTLSKGGNPDIYALRVGTSDFRQLTNNRGIETDPTWSPTGREIAFTSDRSGSPQIWVMDAEGTNPRRLTTGGSYDTQPRWSPARGHDRLHAPRRRADSISGRISPDGSNARAAHPGQRRQRGASWAPNGRHVVFSSVRAAAGPSSTRC